MTQFVRSRRQRRLFAYRNVVKLAVTTLPRSIAANSTLTAQKAFQIGEFAVSHGDLIIPTSYFLRVASVPKFQHHEIPNMRAKIAAALSIMALQ